MYVFSGAMAQQEIDEGVRTGTFVAVRPHFDDDEGETADEVVENSDAQLQYVVSQNPVIQAAAKKKRKGTTRKKPKAYTEQDLADALKARKETHRSLRAISAQYKVPINTIQDHFHKHVQSTKRGNNQ